MKLASILFRGRQPQNEKKVPFKALLPLELRDFVSSKYQRTTEKGCFYEMTSLLTCLEENEFEDKRCISQIKALNQCFKVYNDNKQRNSLISEKPIPESKNLTHKQITYLLRRYPAV